MNTKLKEKMVDLAYKAADKMTKLEQNNNSKSESIKKAVNKILENQMIVDKVSIYKNDIYLYDGYDGNGSFLVLKISDNGEIEVTFKADDFSVTDKYL